MFSYQQVSGEKLPQKWSEHCFESCNDTATCSQEALPWNMKHLSMITNVCFLQVFAKLYKA